MAPNKEGTWPTWLPLRPDLQDLKPYGAPQMKDVVALNTNENPFELPEACLLYTSDAADE